MDFLQHYVRKTISKAPSFLQFFSGHPVDRNMMDAKLLSLLIKNIINRP